MVNRGSPAAVDDADDRWSGPPPEVCGRVPTPRDRLRAPGIPGPRRWERGQDLSGPEAVHDLPRWARETAEPWTRPSCVCPYPESGLPRTWTPCYCSSSS